MHFGELKEPPQLPYRWRLLRRQARRQHRRALRRMVQVVAGEDVLGEIGEWSELAAVKELEKDWTRGSRGRVLAQEVLVQGKGWGSTAALPARLWRAGEGRRRHQRR